MQENNPFFNATEFSVIPCTVTEILHLGYRPSHYTTGGDCTGQVCWNADGQKSTGNTVHIRIISVTIQA